MDALNDPPAPVAAYSDATIPAFASLFNFAFPPDPANSGTQAAFQMTVAANTLVKYRVEAGAAPDGFGDEYLAVAFFGTDGVTLQEFTVPSGASASGTFTPGFDGPVCLFVTLCRDSDPTRIAPLAVDAAVALGTPQSG